MDRYAQGSLAISIASFTVAIFSLLFAGELPDGEVQPHVGLLFKFRSSQYAYFVSVIALFLFAAMAFSFSRRTDYVATKLTERGFGEFAIRQFFKLWLIVIGGACAGFAAIMVDVIWLAR